MQNGGDFGVSVKNVCSTKARVLGLEYKRRLKFDKYETNKNPKVIS